MGLLRFALDTMNRRVLEWLQGEIQSWEREGLLSPEQASWLRRRYHPGECRPLIPLLLSIFGGLLIGLGVVLLLAHNWDQIPRWGRLVVAYLPLMAAIVIAARVVVGSRHVTVAAQESAGLFLFLTMGATLSLVAQSYHIGGSFRHLLLLWMGLALLTIYALDATAPALLYLIGITVWTILQRSEEALPYGYWGLLAALLPYGMMLIRGKDRRAVWLSWGLGTSASVALGFSLQGEGPMPWLLGYLLFFAILMMSFAAPATSESNLSLSPDWAWPLFFLGASGLGGVGWMLAFSSVWEETTASEFWDPDISRFDRVMGALFLFLLVLGAAVTIVKVWRRSDWPIRLGGLFSLLTILLVELHLQYEAPALIVAVVNLFLVGWSAAIVGGAVRRLRTGLLNAGLLLFCALVAARFFDADLSYLVRGIVFVALGVLFLIVNRWMARQRGVS